MRVFSFHSLGNWKFQALISSLFFMALGVGFSFVPNDYPRSKIFLNPVSGKYDPGLEAWIAPKTYVLEGRAGINLGDNPEETVLYVLSPVLRMNPTVKEFTVSWSSLCCTDSGQVDGGQDLVYNRVSGLVTYHYKGEFMGKTYDETKLIARGIKDSDIHRLAAQNLPYTELGK